MHVGSNPTARTSQSQSPRSPYRGAGRLFSYPVRRLDGFLPAPNHDMRFSSFFMPPRLPNSDMRFPSFTISPPSVPFPVPMPRRVLFDSPHRAPIRLGGKRLYRPSFLHFLSDGRGELDARSSPRSSVSPIGFSHPASPRFPPGGSVSPLFRADERGVCVFFARVSVSHVDSVATCNTLIDIHAGVVERQTRQI